LWKGPVRDKQESCNCCAVLWRTQANSRQLSLPFLSPFPFPSTPIYIGEKEKGERIQEDRLSLLLYPQESFLEKDRRIEPGRDRYRKISLLQETAQPTKNHRLAGLRKKEDLSLWVQRTPGRIGFWKDPS
jgi:hypothetical protein